MPVRHPLGLSKAGTRGPRAAISDFLTAMPEKRLPIIKIGTVEEVGLRATKVRTLDRTLVNIPNGEFA